MAHEYKKQNQRRDYQYELSQQRKDNSFYLDSGSRNGRSGAYEIGEPNDLGSVEIQNIELGPADHNYERQPISKVRESILRLEIESLKRNR